MRTVTIEKSGNSYTVNPNASSGGPLNMFNSTIPCYIPRDNNIRNSPTIILLLPDGTPTTADNISSVTKILLTGVVGGNQYLYYLDNDGGITEVPGFEDVETIQGISFSYSDGYFYDADESINRDNPMVFAELNLFTIMLSGYYGG